MNVSKSKEVKKTEKPQSVAKPKKTAAVKKSAVVSHGVGRRKRAVARIWLRRGKGSLTVNGKDYKKYFSTDFDRTEAYLTFNAMNVGSYDADVNVKGGGSSSQAEAIKLGVARALVNHNPDARIDLRKWRLLTVDSRVKERKKYGQKGARRKFQFVKR